MLVRATQKKFTVSVVALIRNSEGKVLLLDHLIRPGASWGLPGGFVEPSEQPEDAIVRELLEETGLSIESVRLVEVRTIGRHVEVLFHARAEGDPVPGSREIRSAGWFRSSELPEDLSEVQRRKILKELNDEPA